jgi:hypothetical protein
MTEKHEKWNQEKRGINLIKATTERRERMNIILALSDVCTDFLCAPRALHKVIMDVSRLLLNILTMPAEGIRSMPQRAALREASASTSISVRSRIGAAASNSLL